MLKRLLAACAIATALTPTFTQADGYGAPPDPNGYTPPVSSSGAGLGWHWGLVPGIRIGAVRGNFDGTTAMPKTQTGWGFTTEIHLDLIRTFDGDRRAFGFSLGRLSQSHKVDDLASVADPTMFEHTGMAATLMLSTVLGGRNSVAARAGLVSGETRTGAGVINGSLTRLGIEVTHVNTFWDVIDVASHVSVEYFTGGEARNFNALAFVYGATFAFGGI